ncbi:class I ribonucleotide reductase maintenance protein YfaE [Pseudoalteromonas sp. TAB23]|uniref:class I ribonucleotide reductase maintenance protein YfaE n=1 Tax=Pseudoalteromonas sp. TAB23 TaxID=1938595 RepID=UPI0003F97F51|nr:class I ribonucleotide reductase maintenance protein YfaE [Pseudoalteromonas sp. TAB23]
MEITLPASNDTLLVQMENKQISVETHCRSGFCGICKKRLLSGEVIYHEKPIAFLGEGEVLVCCASATTEVVILNQD